MGIKFGTASTSTVQYGSLALSAVNYGSINVFPDTFTYTTGTLPTGMSALTCYRHSSQMPGASTGIIADGGTIYYGDVLYWEATVLDGWQASIAYGTVSSLVHYEVTGDVNGITVTTPVMKVYVTFNGTRCAAYKNSALTQAYTSGWFNYDSTGTPHKAYWKADTNYAFNNSGSNVPSPAYTVFYTTAPTTVSNTANYIYVTVNNLAHASISTQTGAYGPSWQVYGDMAIYTPNIDYAWDSSGSRTAKYSGYFTTPGGSYGCANEVTHGLVSINSFGCSVTINNGSYVTSWPGTPTYTGYYSINTALNLRAAAQSGCSFSSDTYESAITVTGYAPYTWSPAVETDWAYPTLSSPSCSYNSDGYPDIWIENDNGFTVDVYIDGSNVGTLAPHSDDWFEVSRADDYYEVQFKTYVNGITIQSAIVNAYSGPTSTT